VVNTQSLNAMDEPSLLRLYMELTGASESMARGVMMHVCFQEPAEPKVADETVLTRWRIRQLSESVRSYLPTTDHWLKKTVPIPVPV